MSFSSIKDPVKREFIVQDYKRLKDEIREKYENKKSFASDQTLKLEKRYAPIVRSQKEMADNIVKELRLNNGETYNPIKNEHEEDLYSGHLAEEYRRRWSSRDPDIDTEFGINFLQNGVAVIGETPIIVQGDDIIIGSEEYDGSEGLWQLLTEKNKKNFMLDLCSDEDWENY